MRLSPQNIPVLLTLHFSLLIPLPSYLQSPLLLPRSLVARPPHRHLVAFYVASALRHLPCRTAPFSILTSLAFRQLLGRPTRFGSRLLALARVALAVPRATLAVPRASLVLPLVTLALSRIPLLGPCGLLDRGVLPPPRVVPRDALPLGPPGALKIGLVLAPIRSLGPPTRVGVTGPPLVPLRALAPGRLLLRISRSYLVSLKTPPATAKNLV